MTDEQQALYELLLDPSCRHMWDIIVPLIDKGMLVVTADHQELTEEEIAYGRDVVAPRIS